MTPPFGGCAALPSLRPGGANSGKMGRAPEASIPHIDTKSHFLNVQKFTVSKDSNSFVCIVCLVKAIGNGVSEFGEFGVVFRVQDLFLNEFPEPFDEG